MWSKKRLQDAQHKEIDIEKFLLIKIRPYDIAYMWTTFLGSGHLKKDISIENTICICYDCDLFSVHSIAEQVKE